jgi:hypothetical protein
VSVLALAGCSTLRLGYGQLDTLAWWWLDSYLDFTPSQAPQARQALAQWLAWHRGAPLAEDVAALEQVALEAQADATPAQTCRWWSVLLARQELHMAYLAGPLGEALADLQEPQWRHLQTRFEASNREWRDKYLRGDNDQRHRASWERIVDRAETVYGRIDGAQRRFVSERLRGSPWDPHRWLAERQRQQRDALETLRAATQPGTDRAQRGAMLRAWAVRTVRPTDEAARQYRDQLIRFQCELAADLHNRTSPEQRRHAAERFRGWADDLRGFWAGPSSASAPATAAAR